MALEGIAEEGRTLLLYGIGESKVVAGAQGLLDRCVADAHRLESRGDPLGLDIVLVTFAEQDIVTHHRGLIVAQRIAQARLDAARPRPMAQLGDTPVIDRCDRYRTSQLRLPPHRHPEIGGLQLGQVEDCGMEAVEDEERGQDHDPDEQRAPCVPVTARFDSGRRGHRAKVSELSASHRSRPTVPSLTSTTR